MSTASYVAAEFNSDLQTELDRLAIQVELSWARELRLLQWIGLTNGSDILEMGCGPGLVTERLMADFPQSHITLLDAAPEMVAWADERLDIANDDRLAIVQAEADETDLPSNSFDFVIARYLYQHLDNTERVTAEALRLLRPGGTLAIIDCDDGLWGMARPAFPQSASIYAKAAVAQADRGGDRYVGHKLWRMLRDGGFTDVELDTFSYHSDEQGLTPFLPQLSPDRLLPALRDGALNMVDYLQANVLHNKFINDDDAYVLLLGFLAHGRKPIGNSN